MVQSNLLFATVAASLLYMSNAAPSQSKYVPRDVDFPAPTCTGDVNAGFNVDNAFDAIGYYCSTQTNSVGQNGQPVAGSYFGGDGAGHQYQLTFKLTHNDGDSTCASVTPSPNQNDGRDCNTIFHDIVNQCRFRDLDAHARAYADISETGVPESPTQQNGGSITWGCGIWDLSFA